MPSIECLGIELYKKYKQLGEKNATPSKGRRVGLGSFNHGSTNLVCHPGRKNYLNN